MFEVCVVTSFGAAHNLRGYRGKCEELHGHNWKVETVLAAGKLDKIGMVADFTVIKADLKNVLSQLDHKYLNDVPYFKKINPTSENIAKFIYAQMKKLARPGVKISRVTVWETDTSFATYFE